MFEKFSVNAILPGLLVCSSTSTTTTAAIGTVCYFAVAGARMQVFLRKKAKLS